MVVEIKAAQRQDYAEHYYMDEKTALHTAARRFCGEQHSRWADRYMELERTGNSRVERSSMDWDYSDESYRLFPRYRLDEGMLVELERLTPTDSDSVEMLRKALVEASQHALHQLTLEFKNNSIARGALREEFDSVRRFIETRSKQELDAVIPLPHRRVLRSAESKSVWAVLKARWTIRGRGAYWYPLAAGDPPPEVIAFHQELWDDRGGHELLLRFLSQHSIHRCFLLQELEAVDYEIDVALIVSRCTGDESFVTCNGDWLLYMSHESSLTVAGSLALFFQKEWSDFEQIVYGGPFHTSDLRGTWNFPDTRTAT